MHHRRFFKLVQRALDAIPPPYSQWLDNIDILVEPRPTSHQRREAGLDPRDTLLGLYEGVPQTERDSGYGMVLPDRITIFQEPLQDICDTEAELAEEVRVTVLHELAHHFGISDDELERLGLD